MTTMATSCWKCSCYFAFALHSLQVGDIRSMKIIKSLNTLHLRLLLAYTSLTYHTSYFCLSCDSKTELKCTFRLNKQICDLNHAYSLTSMQQSAFLVGKHLLRAQEMNPLKGESSFPKPVHAARVRVGRPGANHGPLQPSLAAAICM